MSARIYWYPEPSAYLEVLDLGRGWSEHAPGQTTESSIATTGAGKRTVTTFGSWRRARFAAEYLDDATVVDELYAVADHLRRGGTIGVAEDAACTWGGFAKIALTRGDTTLKIHENLWAAWETPVLAAGDVVVVRGGGTAAKWEQVRILSISGNQRTVTLDRGLRFDYDEQPWVLIHDRRFWPALRATDRQLQTDPIQTDHRITWDLVLDLEEDAPAIAAAAAAGTPFRGEAVWGGTYRDPATFTSTAGDVKS